MALPCCFADLRAVAVVLHLVLAAVARCQVAVAAAGTNLTVGTPLRPPGYITSPSGTFAFGFRALDGPDPTKFLLATWFRSGDGNESSSEPQSVVWFVKQPAPSGPTLVATAASVLSVTAEGALALTDVGHGVLWSTEQRGGFILALGDSGNLQLIGGAGVVWASFWYPTDTLLPGQSLALDNRSAGGLYSKRADAEFSTGRFNLGIQADGNVVLYVDLPYGNNSANAYWQAFSNSPDADSGTTVTFDAHGRLNYTLRNGTVRSLITPVASVSSASFQFARMDPDGVVRTYVRSRDGASWLVSGAFPADGCAWRTSGLQGMCAPGSFCVQQTSSDRLQCTCPPGYNYADAQHSDSGCAPAFEPQSCGGGGGEGGEFTLVELQNVTWESSIYYKKFPSSAEDQCRDSCLADCFCAAALVVGGGTECVELAALTNGRRENGVTTKALIKVRTSNPRSPPPRTRTGYKIVTVCLGSLLALTLLVGGLLAHYYLRKEKDRDRYSEERVLSSSVRAFTWKELYQATNGFDKLLGKGSFGEVYKGTIRGSPQPLPIAVKKLIASNEYTEQEFANEVRSVGQIHHRNLVRMLGYCKEGSHRMLVFEFMPGGSLRGALFNNAGDEPPWPWRAEAALAIARGLEYLHDGCTAPIIHCDIKPDNILLDGRGVPRITDFGISKLLGGQQVHATVTNVRGTRGYIAPEWLRGDARVDTRADVYSFGVVLLEMICCRRCQEPVVDVPGQDGDETVTLFGWAAQLVTARRTELMLHGCADAAEGDLERVERFVRVALWCVEPNPALRPTMHQVVHLLETSDQGPVPATPDAPPGCFKESSPLIPQPTIK